MTISNVPEVFLSNQTKGFQNFVVCHSFGFDSKYTCAAYIGSIASFLNLQISKLKKLWGKPYLHVSVFYSPQSQAQPWWNLGFGLTYCGAHREIIYSP
jgi:hypothetical protein